MQKKIPMRMCIGCHENKPKKELIRIVRSPEGEISLDFTGKKAGRGGGQRHRKRKILPAKGYHVDGGRYHGLPPGLRRRS